MATGVRVVPGLALPFFPMRPIEGRSLSTPQRAVDLWREFTERGDTLQPKLNGDRACVAVLRTWDLTARDVARFKPINLGTTAVIVQSRHGGRFRHNVANLSLFARLAPGSCFDGEVHKQQFYPFEALALDGESLMREGPERRAAVARSICRRLKIDWLFDPPRLAFLRLHVENMPFWEGFVRKVVGSPYVVCPSETATSPKWFKYKWA